MNSRDEPQRAAEAHREIHGGLRPGQGSEWAVQPLEAGCSPRAPLWPSVVNRLFDPGSPGGFALPVRSPIRAFRAFRSMPVPAVIPSGVEGSRLGPEGWSSGLCPELSTPALRAYAQVDPKGAPNRRCARGQRFNGSGVQGFNGSGRQETGGTAQRAQLQSSPDPFCGLNHRGPQRHTEKQPKTVNYE